MKKQITRIIKFVTFLVFLTSGLHFAEEVKKPKPSTGLSLQTGFLGSYSPLDLVTESYETYSKDAKADPRFSDTSSIPKSYFGGAFLDMFYQFNPILFAGGGLEFSLQFPSGMDFYRAGLNETYHIDYLLNTYSAKFNAGILFLRSANWYLLGFVSLRFALGTFTFEESTEGENFAQKRTSLTGATSFGYGFSVSTQAVYRLSPKTGILLGIRGGFLNFSQWSGKDPLGNPIKLYLASGASGNRLIFLKDGENPPGDEKETSLVYLDFALYFGVHQQL